MYEKIDIIIKQANTLFNIVFTYKDYYLLIESRSQQQKKKDLKRIDAKSCYHIEANELKELQSSRRLKNAIICALHVLVNPVDGLARSLIGFSFCVIRGVN